jgi:hypothetical protein
LAAFNTRFRSGLKFRPPRFISKFSIDMAERNGVDLRRELRSADFFKERASARGLLSLKTPDSRSSALLVFMTCDDHRLAFGRSRGWAERGARAVDGFFAAIGIFQAAQVVCVKALLLLGRQTSFDCLI